MKAKLRNASSILLLIIILSCIFTSPLVGALDIKIGYFDYDGFLTVDENGKIGGYAGEILDMMISEHSHWRFIPVKFTRDRFLENMRKGNAVLSVQSVLAAGSPKFLTYTQYAIGTEQGIFYTSLEQNVNYEDFEIFDGMRVGAITGDPQIALFDSYQKEHGFAVEYKFFSALDKIKEALFEREIDGLIYGSIVEQADLKIVSRYAKTPIHVAANEWGATFISNFDSALKKAYEQNPNFAQDLYAKYYGDAPKAVQALSLEEEKALLESDKQAEEQARLARELENARVAEEKTAKLAEEEAARLKREEAAKLEREEAERLEREEAERLEREEAERRGQALTEISAAEQTYKPQDAQGIKPDLTVVWVSAIVVITVIAGFIIAKKAAVAVRGRRVKANAKPDRPQRVARNAAKNASREIAGDAARDIAKDITKDLAGDAAGSATEDPYVEDAVFIGPIQEASPFDWEAGISSGDRGENESLKDINLSRLSLSLQPRYSINQGKIMGAGVSVSFQHPIRDWIYPTELVKSLEDKGHLYLLDRYIFKRLCALRPHEKADSDGSFEIIVPVFTSSVTRSDFSDWYINTAMDLGIPAAFFRLDIVYRWRHELDPEVYGELDKLRRAGFKIALKDVGRENYPLSVFSEVDMEAIVVSEQLVIDALSDNKKKKLLMALNAMCERMGYSFEADCVDSREKLQLMTEVGCQVYQGNFLTRAISYDQFWEYKKRLDERYA